MTKVEIKVPRMGESIAEVTVSKILKETNSSVKIDEEILEVETDKLNQVLYAPATGVITLNVKVGDVLKIGETLGSIESKVSETPQVENKISEETPKIAIRVEKEAWIQELKGAGSEEIKESVKKEIPPKEKRNESRKKMSAIRKVIASRMVAAKQGSAMLTTFNEVDMSHIISLREKYQESFQKRHGVKLGFMSFFVKACTFALQEFPLVNSYISQDDLVYRNYIDIGVAISTERGLIVPVLKDCNLLTFPDIEKKIIDFAKRAKTGDLSVDELQGGGFTITNGGIFGSLLSTPIINPPQCAILGMHKIVKRPVCEGDQIVAKPMMYLALSYDHRVLDGREAVTFLVRIKELIEDSERISLDV